MSPTIPIKIVAAPTKRIEFTGVLYFSCSFVNHAGRRSSQPATIGRRVLPPNITLACAILIDAKANMVIDAIPATIPKGPRPTDSICGIGAMRSICSFGTRASIELVPKMNIRAMIGAAIITERPMDRPGS